MLSVTCLFPSCLHTRVFLLTESVQVPDCLEMLFQIDEQISFKETEVLGEGMDARGAVFSGLGSWDPECLEILITIYNLPFSRSSEETISLSYALSRSSVFEEQKAIP